MAIVLVGDHGGVGGVRVRADESADAHYAQAHRIEDGEGGGGRGGQGGHDHEVENDHLEGNDDIAGDLGGRGCP